MSWMGTNIKTIAQEKKTTLTEIAAAANVSRQTVNDWIHGQVPSGHHLIALCRFLQITPDKLFAHETEPSIVVPPLHRKKGASKVTATTQEVAMELALEYAFLFRNHTEYMLLPIIRTNSPSRENAVKIADELRKLAGLPSDNFFPINYENTFKLLHKLGINVIFRAFPEPINSYAFYTQIHDHRVIFVNNNTNLLDLIFPLLHEAVHAIRDEKDTAIYNKSEEEFCDTVASHVQFPDDYILFVYENSKNLKSGARVNMLRDFAIRYKHSLYGVIKRIQAFDPKFEFNFGADTNLKKRFTTIGSVIFKSEEPVDFVKQMYELSPGFLNIVIKQLENLSDRKLGELLGFESVIDIYQLKPALRQLDKQFSGR